VGCVQGAAAAAAALGGGESTGALDDDESPRSVAPAPPPLTKVRYQGWWEACCGTGLGSASAGFG
jgi:hypothetical protein